jgi:hypothetical protein
MTFYISIHINLGCWVVADNVLDYALHIQPVPWQLPRQFPLGGLISFSPNGMQRPPTPLIYIDQMQIFSLLDCGLQAPGAYFHF